MSDPRDYYMLEQQVETLTRDLREYKMTHVLSLDATAEMVEEFRDKLAASEHRAKVAERALENACNALSAWGTETISSLVSQHKAEAERQLAGEGK
jgi:DNA-binding HxlR family transcriptional regulator